MNVLITGGAGFIGSNLAKKLVNMNQNVIALDICKNPTNLQNIVDKIGYIKGDVRDKNLMNRVFNDIKIDGIIHLAAVSRVIWGEEDPNKCIDVNINGTRILFESVKQSKQRPWIILGSSREVYGEPDVLPVCETCKLIPVNLYGITKMTGENLLKRYSKELSLNSAILRFSNVYGNENDIMDRVVPRFIISALKGDNLEIHGGNQLFDFTHIDDTVNGIIKTVKLLEENGGPYTEDFHILTGKGTTLQDVVSIISNNLEIEPSVLYTDPRNYDVERFIGDPTKANQILNYKAKILPETGIPVTITRLKEVYGL